MMSSELTSPSFGLQGRRGRLGARSKYVDVLNPGGAAGGGDGGGGGGGGREGGPPPPPTFPLMSSMPGTMAQPFTGSFFVPQQPGMLCVCVCVCVEMGGRDKAMHGIIICVSGETNV